MAPKKPSPSPATLALQKELEYLYLRRQLVDDLILALEIYGMLGPSRKGKSRAAA